jgi:hypothetical protein
MTQPGPYSLHPSVAHVQAMVANLEAQSGKTLSVWLRTLKAKGPRAPAQWRAWLGAQGLGPQQAGLVAERANGQKGNTFDDTEEGYLEAAQRYVEQQYAGKKAPLHPLYEALLATGLATGSEAKACPCQTMVPLFRQHVFAQIKPTTQARIDLGLALGDPQKVKAPGTRLLQTGGFAKRDRITHRIEVTSLADIDATLLRWLKVAYERDA